MPTPHGALQRDVESHLKSYQDHKERIARGEYNVDDSSEGRKRLAKDLIELIKQREKLLDLSIKLNELIKEHPQSREQVGHVVKLLNDVGEELKKQPVEDGRLEYNKKVSTAGGVDTTSGDAFSTSRTYESSDSLVSESITKKYTHHHNDGLVKEGKAFLIDIQKNTEREALAKVASTIASTEKFLNTLNLSDKYQAENFKPPSRGFISGIGSISGKKSTAQPVDITIPDETEKYITRINGDLAKIKEEKGGDRISLIRGCLLHHRDEVTDPKLKNALASLLTNDAIKKQASKEQDKEDIATFKTTINPTPATPRMGMGRSNSR